MFGAADDARAARNRGDARLSPPPSPPPLFHEPLPLPLSSPPGRDGVGPGPLPPLGPNREVMMCGLTMPLIQVRRGGAGRREASWILSIRLTLVRRS